MKCENSQSLNQCWPVVYWVSSSGSLQRSHFWRESKKVNEPEDSETCLEPSDFTALKRVVGGWIDEALDHRMLLHRDDPVLPHLQAQGEPVYVMDVNPTAENIARLIFEYAAGKGFPVVEVKLWETDSCFAGYSERGV